MTLDRLYLTIAIGVTLAVSAMLFVLVACTPMQRSIVRTVGDLVLELAEEVCDDADTPGECLRKCHDEADKRAR